MQLASGLRDLARELRRGQFLRSLPVGVVCGLITTVSSLAYAALVFSGGLSSNIAAGMGVMLVSSAVAAVVAALTTTYAPTYAQVRDVPLAYLALVAPTLAAQAGGAAGLPTVVALIALSTLLVGASFLALGMARLGRVVRFVPFPVVSGFLAGVAWLIVTGAVTILTGEPFTIPSLVGLVEPDQLPKLLVLVAVVVASLIGRRWIPPGLLFPAIVVIATAAFHLVADIGNLDPAELTRLGWLTEIPSGALWPPVQPEQLAFIDWPLVLGAWPTMAAIVIVTMVALLLNVSGLEIEVRRDIDLDAELKTAGAGSLLSGVLGGAVAYQSLSMTLLSQRLGGGNRTTTLVAGLFVLVVLLFGADIISLVPLPVLAAIVLATGIGLFIERLVVSYRQLPASEYLIVLGIFVVTITLGFLTAVVFGLVAAMGLFVIDYSRAGVVKLAVTGRDFQSSADSSASRRHLLHEYGDAILIMRLQGYLFFGTANGLRRAIERRLLTVSDSHSVRFVVLDFRRISGIDSAAVQSFVRLAEIAREVRAQILLANVPAQVGRILVRGGLALGDKSPVRLAESFEQGLAECEQAIIAEVDPDLASRKPQGIDRQLSAFVDADEIPLIARFLERVPFDPGNKMMEEGTPAEEIYFLESGTASVRLSGEDHELILATLGPGSIAGEVAFYMGSVRTASVVVDTPVVAWRFTRDSLQRMQSDFPAAASRFHQGMAEVMADRLAATNRLVRFLAA
ncbi:MAG: SulP family inorganic anion transporter [Bauldia sp.]